MTRRRWSLLVAVLAALLAWSICVVAQFDTPNRSFHNATAFRLEGKHQAVACEACHINGQYQGTPKTCMECHWVRRKDDRYQTRLGTQCEQCHRPIAWTAVQWDHAQTGFRLNADHRQLACESCHRGANFRSGSANCVSCHQKDYTATKSPNHAAAGFPVTCDACHRPDDSSWQGAGIAGFHAVFALVGIHATQACASCHVNNIYRGTPRTCVGCHQTAYNNTRNPNHIAASFPTACESCHRPTDPQWTGSATFNHAAVFPLVGLHASQTCAVCHVGNVYRGTPRTCVGCHQAAYNNTRNPNHVAANFPTTCESCHRPTDSQWSGGGTFNHAAVFPLVGLHASQACAVCHVNNVYRGTPRTCVGCHQTAYNNTRNPNHIAAGFPTTCESCHRPTDARWTGVTFNHAAVFPLVGLHASQACAVCHVNNVYRGTPRTCVGCHQTAYNNTRTPNHVAAGFPTTCDTCHRPTDSQWAGATFNHAAVFPLVGLHASQACAVCHVNNVYRGTPRTCVGCHQTAYNNTRTPNHVAAGFPTTCDTCHRPTDSRWTGATFNHAAVFPLVGLHASQACAVCHVNNVYRGTPRTCVGCHQTAYNNTRTPNHAAAGFPTTCDTCHRPTDSSWLQGTFNHTRFPLSGRHNVSCAQCHTTPNNFAVFSCTVCHTRSETDSKHRGRNGYVYESNACYSCHPNGRAG